MLSKESRVVPWTVGQVEIHHLSSSLTRSFALPALPVIVMSLVEEDRVCPLLNPRGRLLALQQRIKTLQHIEGQIPVLTTSQTSAHGVCSTLTCLFSYVWGKFLSQFVGQQWRPVSSHLSVHWAMTYSVKCQFYLNLSHIWEVRPIKSP